MTDVIRGGALVAGNNQFDRLNHREIIGEARRLIGASSGPDWTAIGPATGLARARVMRDWRSILLLEQAVVLISRNIAGDAVDLLVDRPALPIT
jgi:hypothetical protein